MMTDVNDVREARQPRNQGFLLAWHIGADSALCLVAGTFSEQAAASCSACPAGLFLLMHRTCLDCISHEGLPPSRPESGQPAWVLMSLCLSLCLCLSHCVCVSVSVSESQSFCLSVSFCFALSPSLPLSPSRGALSLSLSSVSFSLSVSLAIYLSVSLSLACALSC